MNAETSLPLPSGRSCTLRARPLPWLPTYHVLFLSQDTVPTDSEEREMFGVAHSVATDLAVRFCGDPGCYTILFSGPRTRRRPWPHFHIVAVRNVFEKRRALLLLYFKQVLILFVRVRAWFSAPAEPGHADRPT